MSYDDKLVRLVLMVEKNLLQRRKKESQKLGKWKLRKWNIVIR